MCNIPPKFMLVPIQMTAAYFQYYFGDNAGVGFGLGFSGVGFKVWCSGLWVSCLGCDRVLQVAFVRHIRATDAALCQEHAVRAQGWLIRVALCVPILVRQLTPAAHCVLIALGAAIVYSATTWRKYLKFIVGSDCNLR